MKKIVLLGAFDRYNYGDNLMPILFEMYVEKYAPSILNEFSFEYAAIGLSDLSHYKCLRTDSINKFIDDKKVSAVIVVGGEVLCATNVGLFLHMQKNNLEHLILKRLKKIFGSFFTFFSNKKYSAAWEYPYIPSSSFFNSKPKIIFNTVGGHLHNLNKDKRVDVERRLNSAQYISVRDKRTEKSLSGIKGIKLVPDSVYIMSDLVADEFLLNRVSSSVSSLVHKDYMVFQAAPNKLGETIENTVEQLRNVANFTNKNIVLLPIGYASGHDDLEVLKKINKGLPESSSVYNELNIWEIMYVIKNSYAFMGTSLHGVITAMSFGVPHIGINGKVAKLDSFLKSWSIPPFNKCYEVKDISLAIESIKQANLSELEIVTKKIIEEIKLNNKTILDRIINDSYK